ncbi:MAG: methyltransferase family protein [Candidatus Thorarchaeota archaeon]
MSKREHASALLLPISVLILIPWILSWLTMDTPFGSFLPYFFEPLLVLSGLTLVITGLVIMVHCVRLFANIGKGTLAPWAPTKKLVVVGIYRYERNPMITGVLMVLMGETILLLSFVLWLWTAIFFIGNHIYFIKYEEPELVARFGKEYETYRDNVPRWFPRETPWAPDDD